MGPDLCRELKRSTERKKERPTSIPTAARNHSWSLKACQALTATSSLPCSPAAKCNEGSQRWKIYLPDRQRRPQTNRKDQETWVGYLKSQRSKQQHLGLPGLASNTRYPTTSFEILGLCKSMFKIFLWVSVIRIKPLPAWKTFCPEFWSIWPWVPTGSKIKQHI